MRGFVNVLLREGGKTELDLAMLAVFSPFRWPMVYPGSMWMWGNGLGPLGSLFPMKLMGVIVSLTIPA